MGRDQDEKNEFEFQHPPETRGPWANEVAEDRQRAIYCQPCKEKGRKQMAHRVLPGRRGICNWCYRGEPHPEDVKAKGKEIRVITVPPAASLQTFAGPGCNCTMPEGPHTPACNLAKKKSNDAVQEEVMAKKCKCGRPRTHKGRCWVRRGLKAAPETKKTRGKRVAAREAKQESKPARQANGPANGSGEPVSIPVAALDKWFDSLPEKVREELLGRLWAELPAEQKAAVFAREVGA